tara:strand:+ start:1222 stop:2823 length:1602 start_codon:yes stop_codon:yes gene_type:complete
MNPVQVVEAVPADLSSLGLESAFSWIDWAIVGLYLAFTVYVGVRVNRYVKGMGSFLVAGRALDSHISIATLVGSELGLVTLMYASQKGFTGGFAAFHIGVVAGVATLVVGLTGFIVVPLRQMGVMTIPEFYDKRFGKGVRVTGAIILALAGILNMGMFLKAGALFVAGLTGLSDPNTINIIMTVLILLVLVYTTLGGMLSVVITDYFQFVVLSFGLLVACAFAVAELGWKPIVDAVSQVHGEAGFNPLHDGGFGLDYVVWMIFTAGIVSCAVWQTSVMRACSASSVQVVKRLYTWASIGFLVRFLIPQFLGICALAYLWNIAGGQALFSGDASIMDNQVDSLKAMPVFLSQILPVGVIGVIAAGMLAAFMSTHDSYLLCWASVLAHDVVGPLRKDGLSDKQEMKVARALILVIAAFLLVWSLWFPMKQDLWDYMAVTGAIYFTGAFALLLGGLYWKRASRIGAYLALACGCCAVFGLTDMQNSLGKLIGQDIAWPSEKVGLITTAGAIVLMVVGSLLFPDRNPRSTESLMEVS